MKPLSNLSPLSLTSLNLQDTHIYSQIFRPIHAWLCIAAIHYIHLDARRAGMSVHAIVTYGDTIHRQMVIFKIEYDKI